MDILKAYYHTHIYEINYDIVVNIEKSLHRFYLYIKP